MSTTQLLRLGADVRCTGDITTQQVHDLPAADLAHLDV
jgi:hypothetical protein